ncbi:NADH-ubiquinone oxidoreductase 19.3 kDa subunit, mitochondrial [Aspergillus udagawae]|uniref:NADH-ubiquinone oxidoreductase 19.3 kDa subunit, mitochondrial n=1 Tax=Aspergillus udagawae TaxID=91492 RepID=A0A8H3XQQ4_9EURO|nr:NADH-ubiquinone oxidoreductase 19.3 kDa subunit, mitochondrial [Aspergillus udagawae]
MQFLSTIALVATLTVASAIPTGDSTTCSPEQANKCCTGLTSGILNLNVLPALCVSLLGSCNNQAACCETNGIMAQAENAYTRWSWGTLFSMEDFMDKALSGQTHSLAQK